MRWSGRGWRWCCSEAVLCSLWVSGCGDAMLCVVCVGTAEGESAEAMSGPDGFDRRSGARR
jgi:hypothetical protein